MIITKAIVNLYSDQKGEIKKFLDMFYNEKITVSEADLKWEKQFENPIEISDIIGTWIENNDKFKINMWVSFDKNVLINVTEHNADKIIRYIFERYPY